MKQSETQLESRRMTPAVMQSTNKKSKMLFSEKADG
jgi:hypothetical protein